MRPPGCRLSLVMPEVISKLSAAVATLRGEILLAGLMLAWMLATAAVAAGLGHRPAELLVILPLPAALLLCRRWPAVAALVGCAALLTMLPVKLTSLINSALVLPLCLTAFVLCFALGMSTAVLVGLPGTALLALSLVVTDKSFNPILVMITLGPWLAGRIMRSRRALTAQLQARNAELAAEQDRFARESVRYERARISRELHDIVAHCLSVMVVQASAGQRIADADPGGMAEALTTVAEAAAQAQQEIGRLVELLRGDLPQGTPPDLQMIDELVRRAATTGLQVGYRQRGSFDLAPAASQAAYRVVQEALTNALKHAPGAPVMVTVTDSQGEVVICVQNDPPPQRPSALAASGGQFGLSAMRERVIACGGSLTAGADQAGGWLVRAALPGRSSTTGEQFNVLRTAGFRQLPGVPFTPGTGAANR
jgi:signal transduction histidine kinase